VPWCCTKEGWISSSTRGKCTRPYKQYTPRPRALRPDRAGDAVAPSPRLVIDVPPWCLLLARWRQPHLWLAHWRQPRLWLAHWRRPLIGRLPGRVGPVRRPGRQLLRLHLRGRALPKCGAPLLLLPGLAAQPAALGCPFCTRTVLCASFPMLARLSCLRAQAGRAPCRLALPLWLLLPAPEQLVSTCPGMLALQ
jgi:hypothetical protein